MIHSGRAARHARLHKRHRHAEELNLISLIDIFSVLVIFLLVNFGDVAILNMELPAASSAEFEPEPDKPLKLEVIVRGDHVEITNDGDTLTNIANTEQGYDLARLSEFLVRVKTSYPASRDVKLLLDPEVEYDTIVQMMDTLRVFIRMNDEGQRTMSELFPQIALGDAPLASPAQVGER